ncbi:MAG: hypothetical protein FWD57_14520, partial [Polyangiaceae bacterium]|nr:hypothetical protein [Polyangiaceae bacterium]
KLLKHPVHGHGVERIASSHGRRIFSQLTGIDIDAIEHLVVAGYDGSVLFVMDGMVDPFGVEGRFRDVLVRDVRRVAFDGDAVWTYGMTADGDIRALVAMLPDVVVVECGDSFRSKVALNYGLGRLTRTPRAFDLEDMRIVDGALGVGQLRVFFLGPFVGEWENALEGLLRVSSAFGCSVRVGSTEIMDISMRLVGSWGEDSPRAARLLLDSWQKMTRSPLGNLLGCNQPLKGPSLVSESQMIGLDMQLNGSDLLLGLYDAVAADIAEILR